MHASVLGFEILLLSTAALPFLSPLGFPKEVYFHLSKYSAPVFIFTHERSTVLGARYGSSTLGMLL